MYATHYHWMNIATKETGTGPFEMVQGLTSFPHSSELELLRLINKWNAAQPGVWTYWL